MELKAAYNDNEFVEYKHQASGAVLRLHPKHPQQIHPIRDLPRYPNPRGDS